MSRVESAVAAITALAKGERTAFSRAFRDSYLWDEDEQAVPHGPEFVSNQNGQPIESLCSVGVLLDRGGAYLYLTTDLHFTIGKAAFNKRLTTGEFRKKLSRQIVTISRRHVFTFSEIRQFFSYRSRVDLPSELSEYLK